MTGFANAANAANAAIRQARPEDEGPLQRMLELYQYELSDIWDQDLDSRGEYGYSLDRYFRATGATAFVATVCGHYAGFALADGAVKVGVRGNWMDQFFVLKKYRRACLGAALARFVFDAVPGAWEVGQMPDNHAARAFWRRVVGEYTGGNFSEHELAGGWWQGTVQCFSSVESIDLAGVHPFALGTEPACGGASHRADRAKQDPHGDL